MRNTFCHIPNKNNCHTPCAFIQVSIAPSSGDSAQLYLRLVLVLPAQGEVFLHSLQLVSG